MYYWGLETLKINYFLAIFYRLSNITDYSEHQWDLKLDQLLIVIQQMSLSPSPLYEN